ncbi:MAG: hypothetical protein AB1408_07465 [Pseudomonadota bacterium]
MLMFPTLLLMATPNPPIPISEEQMRDIGCVATIALAVGERPDLAQPGKRWSGIVGQRVMYMTGQPREVVALAMTEAAKAQSALQEPAEVRNDRIARCQAIMYGELAAADAASTPLPKPVPSK